MRNSISMGAVAVILAWVSSAGAGEAAAPPTFTKKPVASKTGEKTVVIFAVDRETDVAVYVEDARGKVVRHLVAGVLGAGAPAPLKPGLAQSLEWDGRDDGNQPAQGGPFKVRVALGLKPKFDSFMIYSPERVDEIMSATCGPDGRVYVFYRDAAQNFNQGGIKAKVFDREGRHQRMLVPFPADAPYEKVKPLGTFQDEEGRLVPRVHSWQTLSFYPDPFGPNRGRSMTSAPAVDGQGRVHWIASGGALASLSAEGGSAYPTFLSQPLLGGGLVVEGASLAVGEGDRYLYLSGVGRMKGKDRESVPCIYRLDLATRGAPVPFIGGPAPEAGKPAVLIAPGHIACAKGILYVVDAGRIAAFNEKDGSPAGEFKVAAPVFVGTDPGSGAVYVVCQTADVLQPDLVKFDGIGTGREVCRVKMPKDSHTKEVRHRITVDASQKPVRIWAPVYTYQASRFFCVDDDGAKLTVRDTFGTRSEFAFAGVKDLLMDRRRGELYFQAGEPFRYDEASGKIAKVNPKGGASWASRVIGWCAAQIVFCEDGSLITMGNERGLYRWTRDGQPLPWNGAADNGPKQTGITTTVMTLGPVGSLAVHKDEMYVVSPYGGMFTSLNVHGMDGKVKRTAIWQATCRAIPRVDARGNIYLAEPVKPKGRIAPAFIDGKRPDLNPKEYDPYNYIYGSIIKFPPSGGAVWYEKTLPKVAQGTVPEELAKKPSVEMSYPGTYCRGLKDGSVQGAEWVRFGFSPYSMSWNIGTAACHCENAGFDVDDFGRVFYPNLGQFRVEMVDTANNMIGTFGHYGNQDSGGKDARVKAPEIPFAWPVYVAVSDNYAYVADTVNLRMVKVKLGYAAEETTPIP